MFKFQPDVCNGCHDVLMMSVNLSDIVFLNIRGADYYCFIICGISSSDKLNGKYSFGLKKQNINIEIYYHPYK